MSLLRLTPAQRRRLTRERDRSAGAGVYRRAVALLEVGRGRPAAEVAGLLGSPARPCTAGRPPSPAPATRPPWPTPRGPAGPASSATRARACWRPSSAGTRNSSACRTSAGPSPCSPGRWPSGPAGSRPPTPPAGPRAGSGTPGSGSGTSWPRTPSARKKRRIRRQIRGLPRRAFVLAVDETDLRLFPPLRSGWARRYSVSDFFLGRAETGATGPKSSQTATAGTDMYSGQSRSNLLRGTSELASVLHPEVRSATPGDETEARNSHRTFE